MAITTTQQTILTAIGVGLVIGVVIGGVGGMLGLPVGVSGGLIGAVTVVVLQMLRKRGSPS